MIRTFEDCLNNGAGYEEAHQARQAWAEAEAEIARLRGTDIAPIPPGAYRRPRHYAHSAAWDARRIRTLRASLGLSQDQFARVLRIGQTTCSSWEGGRTRPGYIAISRLIDLERDGIKGRLGD